MKKLFILCLLSCISMIGCGSDSSGFLSVSAPTEAGGIVTATASYSASAANTSNACTGQAINFRWYTVGETTKVKTAEVSVVGHTDSGCTATAQYTLPTTRTENLYVYVIASTGDMNNIEGWQSVLVTQ